MRFYARGSWRLARQIIADVFVLAWVIGWWAASRALDSAIRALSGLERSTSSSLADVQRQVSATANQAAGIPIVGDGLRQPLDQVAASLQGLQDSLTTQASGIDSLASLASTLMFATPVLTLIAIWLPYRLRFARLSRTLQDLATSPEGVELLALRALVHEPLSALQTVTPDPAGAWTRRDPAALAGLAALELRSTGVRTRQRAHDNEQASEAPDT